MDYDPFFMPHLHKILPHRKHLGDVVSQATDKAKAIVHQGQEAVEGIKDGTVANSPNSMKVYTWENHENP